MEARSDPIARLSNELKVLKTKPDFSSADLDRICDELVKEIVARDGQDSFLALVVLTDILFTEVDWRASGQIGQNSPTPKSPELRLLPFLEAIEGCKGGVSEYIDQLCDAIDGPSRIVPYGDALIDWLDRTAERNPAAYISADTIRAAHLRFERPADAATFCRKLYEGLQDPSDLVRSISAFRLGRLYSDSMDEWTRKNFKSFPPLADAFEEVKNQEVNRPGVAGPFWQEVNSLFSCGRRHAFDAGNWMVDILSSRKSISAESIAGFLSIDFHVHEYLSDKPELVKKLIAIDRLDLALAAACDQHRHIDGMREVLIDLVDKGDREAIRVASWHLAYHYNEFHPKGVTEGFVQKVTVAKDSTAYFLFNSSSLTPYAAILYPEPAQADFSTQRAEELIEMVLPATIRGRFIESQASSQSGFPWSKNARFKDSMRCTFSAGGFIQLKGNRLTQQWTSITIGWRGREGAWNPSR